MKRSSGILMHITSLPSPYGIGTLGKEAYAYADFLAASNQHIWQTLPPGPTGFGDSPYQSFSSFAGNPYLIDLDLLVEQGLLEEAEIAVLPYGSDPRRVDYGAILLHRSHVLHAAFQRGYAQLEGEVAAFVTAQEFWLPDYALFMALKAHFGMRPWQAWQDEAIRRREPAALAHYQMLLAEEIRYHQFVQYLFFSQWAAWRTYCGNKGVSLLGDMPIYVALDSADVWAAPELFQLDEALQPTYVAGVPPDYFSATGQLWGNPLYSWEAMAADGFAWWQRRIAAYAQLFDLLRFDHFRGLASYWRVPFGQETAMQGEWVPGPGQAFVDAIRQSFPQGGIIAEDLGILTQDVRDLLTYSGFPGMRVLQFAFDGGWNSLYLPHQYPRGCVCYTGTHDNDTVTGFFQNGAPLEVALAVEYLGLNQTEGIHWGMIRGGMSSVADLFICQMQDVLGLPLRMNTPSTLFGNWQWRMLPGEATAAHARRLARYAAMFGRA